MEYELRFKDPDAAWYVRMRVSDRCRRQQVATNLKVTGSRVKVDEAGLPLLEEIARSANLKHKVVKV